MEHPQQVWFHLIEQLCRRIRRKCEQVKDNGRQEILTADFGSLPGDKKAACNYV